MSKRFGLLAHLKRSLSSRRGVHRSRRAQPRQIRFESLEARKVLDGVSLTGGEELDLFATGALVANNDTVLPREVGRDPVVIQVLANDQYEPGVIPTIRSEKATTSAGTWSIRHEDGAVVYTPLSATGGVDTFEYKLIDADGNESNVATVTVTWYPQIDVDLVKTTLAKPNTTAPEEQNYHLKATHTGLLTTVATFTGDNDVNYIPTLHDRNGNLVQPTYERYQGSTARLDFRVVAGEDYYFCVERENTAVDLVFANLFARAGDTVTLYGTDRDDQMDVSATVVTITQGNASVTYELATAPTTIAVHAGSGNDEVTMRGTTGDDQIDVTRDANDVVAIAGLPFAATVEDVSVMTVSGEAGNDTISLHGTSAPETFSNRDNPTLDSAGKKTVAVGFETIAVDTDQTDDVANLFGSAGNDNLTADPAETTLTRSDGYTIVLTGFQTVSVTSLKEAADHDLAVLNGSASDDTFEADAKNDRTSLTSGDWKITVTSFDEVVATAGEGGTDKALLTDSSGSDSFTASPTEAKMSRTDVYSYEAKGFTNVTMASSTGDTDTATLTAADGDDTLTASKANTLLTGPGYSIVLTNIENVTVNDLGGANDTARFYDSAGDDVFKATPTQATLSDASGSYTITVNSFETLHGVVKEGGNDRAELIGSSGTDTFRNEPKTNAARMYVDAGPYYWVRGFREVLAEGQGGKDIVDLRETAANDVVTFSPGLVSLKNDLVTVTAKGFEVSPDATEIVVSASTYSRDADEVVFIDGAGNDTFRAAPEWATFVGSGAHYRATGFRTVKAEAKNGGNDMALLFDSAGDDTFIADATTAELKGTLASGSFSFKTSGFETVKALSQNGGRDQAILTGSAGADTATVGGVTGIKGYGFDNRANGFMALEFRGGQGNDTLRLFDSPQNDALTAKPDRVEYSYSGITATATGFEHLDASSDLYTSDTDRAILYDTNGDDTLEASPTEVTFTGTAKDNVTKIDYRVRFFDVVNVVAGSGDSSSSNDKDIARLTGSDQNDVFEGSGAKSKLSGSGYAITVYKFNEVHVDAQAGARDIANLTDTSGNDKFVTNGEDNTATLSGQNYLVKVKAFDKVYARATNGGEDTAEFYGSVGDDTYEAYARVSTMSGQGFWHQVRGFDKVVAYGRDGNDTATLHDYAFNEYLEAKKDHATLYGHINSQQAFSYEAREFELIIASQSEAKDTYKKESQLDYELRLDGLWTAES